MKKALGVIKWLGIIAVIALASIFLVKLDMANTYCVTETYTLKEIEETPLPVIVSQMYMYDTKLTFEDADGNTIVVKTANSSEYIEGHKYNVTRVIRLADPAQHYVKIQGA